MWVQRKFVSVSSGTQLYTPEMLTVQLEEDLRIEILGCHVVLLLPHLLELRLVARIVDFLVFVVLLLLLV